MLDHKLLNKIEGLGPPTLANLSRFVQHQGWWLILLVGAAIFLFFYYYKRSKNMQRGAKIMASYGDIGGVEHIAAQNPDGSRVLILTNPGAEQKLQVTLGNQAIDMLLRADSVTTLIW